MRKIIILLLSCIVAYGSINAMEYALYDDQCAFVEAVKNGNIKEVRRLLLLRDIGINRISHGYSNGGGFSPLHLAVFYGHIDVVRELLHMPHIQIDIRSHPCGLAPLHIAADQNLPEIIHELLQDHGGYVDINAPCYGARRTPLHRAAMFGNRAAAYELLQDSRIEANLQDSGGDTPLDLAIKNSHSEIADMINEHTLHVLAMALHLRLGEESGASLLAEDGQRVVFKNIFEYLSGKK